MPSPWVLLYGGMGTGKTHLLAAAFNVLLGAGRYPLYTVVPALLDHIREGLDEPDSREYGARFRAVRSASILLLDDLGAERSSEWSDELLFKLLDYRYREGLPTARRHQPHPCRPGATHRLTAARSATLDGGADAGARLPAGETRKGRRRDEGDQSLAAVGDR